MDFIYLHAVLNL